jgi:hypothetical protein
MKKIIYLITILIILLSCSTKKQKHLYHYTLNVTYTNGDVETITDTYQYTGSSMNIYLIGHNSNSCINISTDFNCDVIVCGVRKFKLIESRIEDLP